MKNRKKILFSTAFKPFGSRKKYEKYNGRHSITELFDGQITFAQDIFSIRSTARGFPLDMIALNIDAFSVVLHYPSLKEFEKELKRKDYDYVALTFTGSLSDKIRIMARKVREISPGTKVIIGGYGVIVPGIEKIADYVCRGEGIGFIRELISDNKNTKKESEKRHKIIHPLIESKSKVMNIKMDKSSWLFNSLGCQGGCEFCFTSHHYGVKKYHFFKNGKEIFDELCRIKKKIGTNDISVMDEDFLSDKKMIEELARCIKKSGEHFKLSVFSSLKSIRKYQYDDLVDLGIDFIWIGIEGKKATYDKLDKEDPKKIISELKRRGISILCSSILGLDYHDKENIKEDYEYMDSLDPTFIQILILSPGPSTPIGKRMIKEKRWPTKPYLQHDGFSLTFKHKLGSKFLEDFQYWCYYEDYRRNGPSIFRYIDDKFQGYRYLKSRRKNIQRQKEFKELCLRCIPLLNIMILFSPSRQAKNKIRRLKDDIYHEFRPQVVTNIIKTLILLPIALFTKMQRILIKTYNPKTERIVYDNM